MAKSFVSFLHVGQTRAKSRKAGLTALQASDAAGCIVLGDPDYYARFGFQSLPNLTLADVPAEYFIALEFKDHAVKGIVEYHTAFTICT